MWSVGTVLCMCLSRSCCVWSSVKNGDPVGPGVASAASPIVTVVPSVTAMLGMMTFTVLVVLVVVVIT